MKSGVKEQLCGFTLTRGDKARDLQSLTVCPPSFSNCLSSSKVCLPFLPSHWNSRKKKKKKHRATMKDTLLWLTLLHLPLLDSTPADRLSFFLLHVLSFGLNLPWLQSRTRFLLRLTTYLHPPPPPPTAHSTVWTIKLTFHTNKQRWLVNLKIYQAFGQPIKVFESNWQHRNVSCVATTVAWIHRSKPN